jgi:hypothetical protein
MIPVFETTGKFEGDEELEMNQNKRNETTTDLNDHRDNIVDDIDKKCDLNASNIDESNEDPMSPPPSLAEIKHLKRRIKNVQEISIQTSRDAIASDVKKYQNNVLNASQNCVNEWRAIARHYKIADNNDKNESDDNAISLALRTEVGLAVFQLIQLSVQSGPLSGAKPGYFKRCGAEVAKVVLDFLEEVVPQHDALGVDYMGFTSRQMETMKKWMVNAGKAVESGKLPSKSVMKKLRQNNHQQKKKK